MTFNLHPNLAKKIFITDFPLCRVLLEDEKHYPWLFLVPRKPNISRMMDLTQSDQMQLIKELDYVQKMMWNEFELTQLNVAAIGNQTPQLHVHVIGRKINDPAWPNTVWDHPIRSCYDEKLKYSIIRRLQLLLSPMLSTADNKPFPALTDL
ncbi:MAG: HIT domain-containing protein [Parachlamydiaceae bacterium]